MFYLLIIINLISFIIFGLDKRKAIRHQRRISENALLGISFVGGTIGSVVGMLLFRHKVSKRSFLLKFGLIVLIQVVFNLLFSKILSLLMGKNPMDYSNLYIRIIM